MVAASIDEAEVRHICHLARIKVTDEQCARLGRQLTEILRYVDKLNEIDTGDVEPTAHALPLRNVFRRDEPAGPIGVEKVLENAPDVEAFYFKVPKVLDQDSA